MRSSHSSILLIFFSGIFFTLLIVAAVFLLLAGSFEKLGILPWEFQNASSGQSFLQALNLMIIGTLILPMGYFNFRHVLGKPETIVKIRNQSVGLIFILTATWFLVVLNVDKIVDFSGDWIRIAELPIFFISMGLPIFIILWISLRGIPLGSKRRLWTIFGLGLILGPLLILISEITILILATFAGAIYFTSNSNLNHELMIFFNQLTSNNSIEGIQGQLIPYLTNPWIILTVLVFVSLVVPIVEEFLKPAGTWLAVKMNMKPRDGFIMGILSGAGYALFETLSASGSMGDGWGMILLGRAGTDLLHIFNTGLIGWAMISDWKLRGWLKFIGIYVLSIFIHGLWNGFALTLGLSNYLKDLNSEYVWLKYAGSGGVVGLVLLSLLMIIGLWVINHKMRFNAIEKNY